MPCRTEIAVCLNGAGKRRAKYIYDKRRYNFGEWLADSSPLRVTLLWVISNLDSRTKLSGLCRVEFRTFD